LNGLPYADSYVECCGHTLTFFSNSVKVLQQYLRARGVANQRKLDLVRLCEAAEEIGI
jgi:hypothetical protein